MKELIEKLERLRLALLLMKLYDDAETCQEAIQSLTKEPSAVSTNSIKERIKHFNSINHSHEANRLESALLAIQELLPPTYIEPSNIQPSAVSAEEVESQLIDIYVNSMQEVISDLYGKELDVTHLSYLIEKAEKFIKAMQEYANASMREETFKYFFECGRNYQNNAEVTFKVAYQEYINTLTTK